MVKITSITQLLVIKENDIVINKSADFQQRFLIKKVDEQKVVLLEVGNETKLKMFPKLNLLSANWWIEK